MNEREQAQALGLMRLGIGVALFVFPRLCARVWLDEDASTPGTRIAFRSLGGREIALGAGLLIALDQKAPARGWVEAGVVADISDAIGVAIAPGVSPLRKLMSVVGACGAAVVGLRLAGEID